MGKGQLAGVPNWLKKQIDNLTTKVTKNETDITELNTNLALLNSDLDSLGTLVYEYVNEAGQFLIVHQIGKVLIYNMYDISIDSLGNRPINTTLRNNSYTIGKAYVNNQDIPVILSISLYGSIYVMNMSGTAIDANYVTGTIIAVQE